MLPKKNLLGVAITAAKASTILEHVIELIHKHDKKFFIVTPNPEIIMYAQSDLDYKDKLNAAEIALPDGAGVILASRLLGLGIPERTTGVDFIEELCKAVRKKPLSMGFLGGRPGVAERTAECLQQKYPWIDVVFTEEEWPDGHENGEWRIKNKEDKEKNSILHSPFSIHKPIDILFVAYGFPKQEEWIYDHLDELPVRAAMGVGGAFDFISGSVPRAPKLMRSLGLEWLFRLMLQPKRFKRQLALPKFIFLVIKARLKK